MPPSYNLTHEEKRAILQNDADFYWSPDRMVQIIEVSIQLLKHCLETGKHKIILICVPEIHGPHPSVVSPFEAMKMLVHWMKEVSEKIYLDEFDSHIQFPAKHEELILNASFKSSGELARLCAKLHDAVKDQAGEPDEHASYLRAMAFWFDHGERLHWLVSQEGRFNA